MPPSSWRSSTSASGSNIGSGVRRRIAVAGLVGPDIGVEVESADVGELPPGRALELGQVEGRAQSDGALAARRQELGLS